MNNKTNKRVTKLFSLLLLFFVLWSAPLVAADDFLLSSPFETSPICMNSSLLPGVISDTLLFDCFDVDIATTLASHPDKLKKYLDNYPLTEITAPFHYWYELRTEHLLNSFILLVTLVNRAENSDIVDRYRGDGDFLFAKVLNHITVEQQDGFRRLLMNQNGGLDATQLELLFLMTFQKVQKEDRYFKKDVTTEYILAVTLYRFIEQLSAKRFFCVDVSVCPLLHTMTKASINGLVAPTLDAFLFFMDKKGNTPSFTEWHSYLRDFISMEKSDKHFKNISVEALLYPQSFLLDHLSQLPKVELQSANEMKERGLHYDTSLVECAYLKERAAIFTSEGAAEVLQYNEGLQFVSGCTPFVQMPASFSPNRIVIDRDEQWIVDAILVMHLLVTISYSEEDRSATLYLALLNSALKYKENPTGNLFGEALLYAFYSHNIYLFMDIHFFAPAGLLSNHEIAATVDSLHRLY
ncbi:hypothetical protein KAH37_06345 [bacterium]|nr:hypothetical protein [bacterium]